jgi:hypothetical protein
MPHGGGKERGILPVVILGVHLPPPRIFQDAGEEIIPSAADLDVEEYRREGGREEEEKEGQKDGEGVESVLVVDVWMNCVQHQYAHIPAHTHTHIHKHTHTHTHTHVQVPTSVCM